MTSDGARVPLAVCAPNAFKGTISAAGAARAIARGVVDAGWLPRALPVADGGDGTLDVLLAAAGSAAWIQPVRVTGPMGRLRLARLGWIGSGVAVVEMAEAAGLRLVPAGRRNALRVTSRGAGELISTALDGGATRIIVGVGGSASTDGGVGILEALGAVLRDGRGRPIRPEGGALPEIASVDLSTVDHRLRDCLVEVAVDVRNPLFGPTGAAHVFAAQKGANRAEVVALDDGLRRLAGLIEPACARPGLSAEPGAGAAGGAGFALAALGARLVGGGALVCDMAGLDEALAGAALVITGEGRLDSQTAAGKAPAEVAGRAHRAGVPCIAVCGSVVGGRDLFAATLALDQLGEDPFARVRSLLRTAGATAVAIAGRSRPADQP